MSKKRPIILGGHRESKKVSKIKRTVGRGKATNKMERRFMDSLDKRKEYMDFSSYLFLCLIRLIRL